MGYKLNGVESEGLPVHLVKMFTDNYLVDFFVETGTAGGESIKVASGLFGQCHTIELIQGRPTSGAIPNVTYYTGDSSKMIPQILPKFPPHNYVLFFLDAHYSDSVLNTSGIKECPVLDELSAISAHQNSIIIIDDARLFFGWPQWPNDPREWPRIDQIFVHCARLFPNHRTTITDDFIICYPNLMDEVVQTEWRARFLVRYPSAADKLKSDAKNVYNALKNYLDV